MATTAKGTTKKGGVTVTTRKAITTSTKKGVTTTTRKASTTIKGATTKHGSYTLPNGIQLRGGVNLLLRAMPRSLEEITMPPNWTTPSTSTEPPMEITTTEVPEDYDQYDYPWFPYYRSSRFQSRFQNKFSFRQRWMNNRNWWRGMRG